VVSAISRRVSHVLPSGEWRDLSMLADLKVSQR